MTHPEFDRMGPPLPQAVVGVDWGKYEAASNGEILETRELSSCIGVAVHDPANQRGYMTHLVGRADIKADSGQSVLEAMMQQIKDEAPDTSGLSVWVCGGTSTRTGESEREIDILARDENRQNVLDVLKTYGVAEASLDVRWNEGQASSLVMQLDSVSGECIIARESRFKPVEEMEVFKDPESDTPERNEYTTEELIEAGILRPIFVFPADPNRNYPKSEDGDHLYSLSRMIGVDDGVRVLWGPSQGSGMPERTVYVNAARWMAMRAENPAYNDFIG